MSKATWTNFKLRNALGELLEVARQIPNPERFQFVVSYGTNVENYVLQPDGSYITSLRGYIKKRDRVTK